MEPTAEQIERASAALLPFVSEWNLPLNPEDLDELAYAALVHHDTRLSFEEIIDTVERRLQEVREQRERLSTAQGEAGAGLDGFSLQQPLDSGGRRILARMVRSDIDMPWFMCSFEPTPYFEDFRGVFEEQGRAIEGEDWQRVEQLARILDRASVQVQRFGAAELPTSEYLLRISGDRARLRYEPVEHAQLLDVNRYAREQVVQVEAHRGSRRASVHRGHAIPESLTARLAALGQTYDLARVASISPYGQDELDQAAARELAQELHFLTRLSCDPLLKPHIDGLQSLADFCWHTDDDAWLTILGL